MTKKTQIVIIDDEEDLCFLLSRMLIAQGFDVKYFLTLKNGMDGVKQLLPDWIIIDNNLPDGLGWEKVNEMINTVPNVHIIKISANPDSYRASHREFVHYLIKPINVNSIMGIIHQASSSAN